MGALTGTGRKSTHLQGEPHVPGCLADDAAGLSLVNGLQANQQALMQSQTNATEGVGLLQVADGALSQVTSLLNRAVTLATEASNGTLNSTQDLAANQEYQSILSEVSNIGSTTTYNQEQVFNSNTNIYTGDSSAQGSSISALNIRSLSASNVGDTSGTMAYSNGTNNVFIDLSSSGKNAAVTDTLGATTATTTVAVNYLSKGANGSAVASTANIAVGAGTNYSNTAQGLISAINNSGLGLTATFGTAANAGTAATGTAVAANDANSALQTTTNDTGIIISGAGVGVNNNSAAAGYTNGAGEVGTVTVSQASDTLGGTLNIVGSNGATHAITLGIANSTDTLANLQATINAAGYGVTASTNTGSTTNGTGTHAAGTIMTLTSADSAVTVAGTNITDAQVAPSVVTLGAAVGPQTVINAVAGTLSAASANDTLTGVLSFTAATGGTAGSINLDGQTLTQFVANAGQTTTIGLAGLTETLNAAGTMVTFTQTAGLAAGSVMSVGTHSQVQDSGPTTGTAVVAQTNFIAIGGAAATLGTVSVSNANDTLTGGTLELTGANGTQTAYTLGTTGTTDTLANLAKQINAATVTTAALLLHATVNSAGTVMTIATTAATGSAAPMLYSTGVTSTSLSLTGTPTTGNAANSTTMGTLSLPISTAAAPSASTDTLSGTLTIGTESITLGTAATTSTPGTATMTELAQTINAGNYGITATLNSAGTAMTFASANSADFNTTPTVSAALDATDTNAPLVWSTPNQSVTSSAYYSVGISGSVADTSTGANTTTPLTKGLSNDLNGTGGTATISYSDAAGQSLSQTDLTTAASAQAALGDLNTAISDVAAQDGYIGAMINTLSSVSQVLSTQQENVQSAQNAVQATDYASATSNMSKYEILSQTGISALAQANSMQQEVVKLLQ
ncbi:MAG: flagellin [Terracidiphilus sp.]